MNLEVLCQQVNLLAKEVGAFIKSQTISSSDVETKSKNSLVTFVDKTAEAKLVARLSELIPESGFIAEEGTSEKIGEIYNWIIDPLDGTTNFIHGVPCFCISIGLKRNNELVLGVIYEINLDELFYAWEGSKAYLNGKEIHVTPTRTLEDSLIATGFPYYDYEKQDEYMNLFKDLMRNSRGLRRLGSAAVDLAYVACGRFDAFYEYSLHPWDVAAGAFIVQQAGGKVCDFKGENDYLFGKEIITCNPHIQQELLVKVKQHFKY
jgi:myo-inositol-1(or 4)-monophosphatase